MSFTTAEKTEIAEMIAAAFAAVQPAPAVKQAPADKQAESWLVPVKRYNAERAGIELVFNGKPVKEIREKCSAAGFRWNRKEKVWYCKRDDVAEMQAAEVIRFCKAGPAEKPAPVIPVQPAAPAEKPAAPAEKPLHVGLTFTAVTREGQELTYTAIDYPDGGKVKVKDADGKAIGAYEMHKTDRGRLFIIVNKRPALLDK